MDKTMNIINADKEDYIDYLIVCMGYSKEDAENMARIMGY